MTPPTSRALPVLVYDGECGFCTSCVRVLERIGSRVEIVAWQLADLPELGITQQQATAAVQLVLLDGTVRSGDEAIAAALGTGGRILRLIARIMLLPGISRISAIVYRLVANNRHRLPGRTPACAGRAD